jgi:hypothetical protein
MAMLLKPTTLSAGNHRMPLPFNEDHILRAGGVFMLVIKAGEEVKTFRAPVIR